MLHHHHLWLQFLLVSPALALFNSAPRPRSPLGGRGAITSSRLNPPPPRSRPVEKRQSSSNSSSSNNSTSSSNSTETNFIWLIQDTYDHTNFFDEFAFFTGADPTNGAVEYVNATTAFENGLAYVLNETNQVIMKGDNTTWLASGANRQSVRVSSYAQYNTGLFILDINRAPWGCGVWPAFWTLGSGTWPETGEIDVIEGVHDNEHNQVTWHTNPGCMLTESANFTGQIVEANGVPELDCTGCGGCSGCGITEWSRASYGPTFDAEDGGVFAMKWDQDGISVWSFYRVAVPQDIEDGSPDPSTWGTPSATLDPSGCNPLTYFVNHSIIFDITFCGDWAGNDYATSGCPGTCADRIMDPSNFDNASWIINTLKVYRRQNLTAISSSGSSTPSANVWHAVSLGALGVLASLLALCVQL